MTALRACADAIQAQVTMGDVVRRYLPAETSRRNYICCPFHSERTPSLRLYEHDYHCFGCGAHGDVVDFVAGVLGTRPVDAIRQIDRDFVLGLPVDRRPTLRETAQARRRASELAQARECIQRETEAVEVAYWAAFDAWLALDRQYEDNRPTDPEEDFSPLFVEAAIGIDRARADLAEAGERRCAHYWKLKRERP